MNNKLSILSTMLLIFLLTSCTSNYFSPKTLSKDELERNYEITISKSNEEVVKAINEVIAELKWVRLEEHHDVTEKYQDGSVGISFKTKNTQLSEYRSAWEAVVPKSKFNELVFIKARTPITPFSYGAQLFIGVSTHQKNTTVRFSGSTNQVVEKENLPMYLEKLSNAVKFKLTSEKSL